MAVVQIYIIDDWLQEKHCFSCRHLVSDDSSAIFGNAGIIWPAFSHFLRVKMRPGPNTQGFSVCLCLLCKVWVHLSWIWFVSTFSLISCFIWTLINNSAGRWRWSTFHLNLVCVCCECVFKLKNHPVCMHASAKLARDFFSKWMQPWRCTHVLCVSAHNTHKQPTFVVIDNKINDHNAPAKDGLMHLCGHYLYNNLKRTENNQPVGVSAYVSLWFWIHLGALMWLNCGYKQARMYHPAYFSRCERETVYCCSDTHLFPFKLSRLICLQSFSSSFSSVSQLPYGLYSAWLTIALVVWHNESEAAHE